MAQKLLKVLNNIFNWIVILCIVLVLLYCGYAIWDNSSIYGETLDLHDRIHDLKPDEKNHLSFEELLKINPDTAAWIQLDGTEIDDPVVQGQDNREYLNKDIYGKYSLAGTLFLDTRCSRDFSDSYSLVYGHHMDRHEMFGDLDLYLDQDFFDQNKTGELTVPGRKYDLQVLACLKADAADAWIFEPRRVDENTDAFLQYCQEISTHADDGLLHQVQADPDSYRIVSLSTCSAAEEDERTVVLTVYKLEEGE